MTMRTLPLILATLAVPAAAQTDRAAMLQVADAFDRAQLSKDKAALEHMIDPELVFVDGDGRRQGKRDFIAGWTAADDRFDPITLIDRTVTPLGRDAFVVTAETTLTGTNGGKRFSSHFRFADTFRRSGGQWRAVHIQVSRIAS